MTLPQHFILSWVVANAAPLDRRSRVCITLAGVVPDIDGAGALADKLGYGGDLFFTYHHVFAHNLAFGLALSAVLALACARKAMVFALCLIAFHLHLVADLAGSMGPDGYQWPVYYLYPFAPDWELTWSGQWELDSWRNSLVGVLAFAAALALARYRGVTFFELVSPRLERTVLDIGRKRGLIRLPAAGSVSDGSA
jgi:inner membrane protein